MTVLLYVLGVVAFAVGLAASIGLHEAGHLIPGKLFDVRVTEFFIGFGRTLWSTRRGETEYGVKAVPLGGYCKLIGMVPPGPDTEPGTVRSTGTGMFAQLVSDTRAAEYEHVRPEDEGRLFYQLSWWRRVIVMGCGVAINLVLAFLLNTAVLVGYGVQEPTTTVGSVSQCVKALRVGQPVGHCTAGDPRAPAAEAGMRPGDRVLAFNGRPVRSFEQLSRRIRANGDGRAAILVKRGDRRLTLHTSTTINSLPGLSDSDRTVRAGFLGVGPATTRQRQDLGDVAGFMATNTWETLKTIGSLPVRVYHVARAAVGLEQRAADSPMSVVGAGRVAGSIASTDTVGVGDRIASLVMLLAGLNLFLGLVNLVPLPPFDGAGVATGLVEAVRNAIARVRGRPQPAPFDAAKLLPVTYLMATLLIVMSLVLVYADIVAPVRL